MRTTFAVALSAPYFCGLYIWVFVTTKCVVATTDYRVGVTPTR